LENIGGKGRERNCIRSVFDDCALFLYPTPLLPLYHHLLFLLLLLFLFLSSSSSSFSSFSSAYAFLLFFSDLLSLIAELIDVGEGEMSEEVGGDKGGDDPYSKLLYPSEGAPKVLLLPPSFASPSSPPPSLHLLSSSP